MANNKSLMGVGGGPKIEKNLGTYLVLALALGAMVFFGICSPTGFIQQLDNVAGSVDGEEITQIEFSRAYSSEQERIRRRYGENAGEMKIAGQVLDQLINYRIMYLESQKLGLDATEDEAISYLNKIKAFRDKDAQFSDTAFRNFLRNNRYSETTFLSEIQRNISVDRLRDLVTTTAYASENAVALDHTLGESKLEVEYLKFDPETTPLTVSDADVNTFLTSDAGRAQVTDYYTSHESEYKTPEKIHAHHILVSHKDARNPTGDALQRSKEEARKRAENILVKVKQDNDFQKIAKENTDEASGKNTGGDLGFFTRDMMVKEFSDAAFALANNTVSDVVESPFGFHIIKTLEKQNAKNTPLEEAQKDIALKLLKREKAPTLAHAAAQEVLDALKAGTPTEPLLKKHNVQWKSTAPFSFNATYIPGLGSKPTMLSNLLPLRKVGETAPAVEELNKNYYVIRLKSRKEVTIGQIEAQKKQEMARSLEFRTGYAFLSHFEGMIREKFEKRNAVYLNPQYLALDKAVAEQ
ncbi:MAG: peptidylprolyl isomerase [Deltaproteobacteria bacterium]|nr:peptidylprolyl isomerase [Deltaproteobacteria bacterium]